MTKLSRQGIKPAAAAQASEPVDLQIRFAIANKRLVQLSYHGRVRVVEPHDYGELNHTTKLLIYQVSTSGDMRKKNPRGWRLLEVSEITECAVLDKMFPGTRGESYKRHLAWEVVYSRVG